MAQPVCCVMEQPSVVVGSEGRERRCRSRGLLSAVCLGVVCGCLWYCVSVCEKDILEFKVEEVEEAE